MWFSEFLGDGLIREADDYWLLFHTPLDIVFEILPKIETLENISRQLP
jgi:hypothetical protein